MIIHIMIVQRHINRLGGRGSESSYHSTPAMESKGRLCESMESGALSAALEVSMDPRRGAHESFPPEVLYNLRSNHVVAGLLAQISTEDAEEAMVHLAAGPKSRSTDDNPPEKPTPAKLPHAEAQSLQSSLASFRKDSSKFTEALNAKAPPTASFLLPSYHISSRLFMLGSLSFYPSICILA